MDDTGNCASRNSQFMVYNTDLKAMILQNDVLHFWHISYVEVATGRPERESSSIDSLPHLNCLDRNFTW